MPILVAVAVYFFTPFVILFGIVLDPWWFLVLLLMWAGYALVLKLWLGVERG